VYVSIGVFSSKQLHKLLGGVAPVHVQSEEAAIFATDCSGRSLELRSVVLTNCKMALYEILDGGNKRIAAAGIEKLTVWGAMRVLKIYGLAM